MAVAPIFEDWLKPWNDVGATIVTQQNTGSTDHISFDRVGCRPVSSSCRTGWTTSATSTTDLDTLRPRLGAGPQAGLGDHGLVRVQRGDAPAEAAAPQAVGGLSKRSRDAKAGMALLFTMSLQANSDTPGTSHSDNAAAHCRSGRGQHIGRIVQASTTRDTATLAVNGTSNKASAG